MTHNYLHIIFSSVIFIVLGGCMPEKYDNVINSWDHEVKLVSNDSSINISGIEVTLTNSNSNIKHSLLSNGLGVVRFENIIRGNYIITAQKFQETSLTNNVIGGIKSNITLTKSNTETTLQIQAYSQGDLLIKEVFYTSTWRPNGIGYLSDQFIEIYNNSNSTIYSDSLCLGVVYGGTGQPNSHPSIFTSDTSNVYLYNIWMIPGNGSQYPIEPYSSIIIAQDAINHKNDVQGNINSIDLSGANWETFQYNPDDQRDIDYAETKNLIKRHDYTKGGAHDWIFNSNGVSIVMFRTKDSLQMNYVPIPNNLKLKEIVTIPSNWVIDGIEALSTPSSFRYKKLPNSIDNSFTYCSGIFTKESIRRKFITTSTGNIILIDTNSSYLDFEVISPPTPGFFK